MASKNKKASIGIVLDVNTSLGKLDSSKLIGQVQKELQQKGKDIKAMVVKPDIKLETSEIKQKVKDLTKVLSDEYSKQKATLQGKESISISIGKDLEKAFREAKNVLVKDGKIVKSELRRVLGEVHKTYKENYSAQQLSGLAFFNKFNKLHKGSFKDLISNAKNFSSGYSQEMKTLDKSYSSNVASVAKMGSDLQSLLKRQAKNTGDFTKEEIKHLQDLEKARKSLTSKTANAEFGGSGNIRDMKAVLGVLEKQRDVLFAHSLAKQDMVGQDKQVILTLDQVRQQYFKILGDIEKIQSSQSKVKQAVDANKESRKEEAKAVGLLKTSLNKIREASASYTEELSQNPALLQKSNAVLKSQQTKLKAQIDAYRAIQNKTEQQSKAQRALEKAHDKVSVALTKQESTLGNVSRFIEDNTKQAQARAKLTETEVKLTNDLEFAQKKAYIASEGITRSRTQNKETLIASNKELSKQARVLEKMRDDLARQPKLSEAQLNLQERVRITYEAINKRLRIQEKIKERVLGFERANVQARKDAGLAREREETALRRLAFAQRKIADAVGVVSKGLDTQPEAIKASNASLRKQIGLLDTRIDKYAVAAKLSDKDVQAQSQAIALKAKAIEALGTQVDLLKEVNKASKKTEADEKAATAEKKKSAEVTEKMIVSEKALSKAAGQRKDVYSQQLSDMNKVKENLVREGKELGSHIGQLRKKATETGKGNELVKQAQDLARRLSKEIEKQSAAIEKVNDDQQAALKFRLSSNKSLEAAEAKKLAAWESANALIIRQKLSLLEIQQILSKSKDLSLITPKDLKDLEEASRRAKILKKDMDAFLGSKTFQGLPAAVKTDIVKMAKDVRDGAKSMTEMRREIELLDKATTTFRQKGEDLKNTLREINNLKSASKKDKFVTDDSLRRLTELKRKYEESIEVIKRMFSLNDKNGGKIISPKEIERLQKLKDGLELANKEVIKQADAYDQVLKARKALDKASQHRKANSASVNNTKNIRAEILAYEKLRTAILASGKATQHKAELEGITKGIKDLSSQLPALESGFGKVASSIKTVGVSFLRYFVGYKILSTITQSVSRLAGGVIKLEDSLKSIQAVARATDQEMIAVEASIKNVATTTEFSVDEIAQAAQTLAQAGVEITKVGEALEAVAHLASATATSLQTSADLVSTMRNVFKDMGVDEIADQLTTVVNISKLTGQGLSTILSRAVQVSDSFKLLPEQMFAAFAVLKNVGIKDSTISTGFRQGLLELFSPDKKTLDALEERYAELGLNLSRASIEEMFIGFQNAESPLLAVISELEKIGFATSAASKFNRVFDVRAQNVINALIKQKGALIEAEQKMKSYGSAAKGAETQLESLSKSWDNLGAVLVSTSGDFFGGVVPVLEDIVDWSAKAVEWLGRVGNAISATDFTLGDRPGFTPGGEGQSNQGGDQFTSLDEEATENAVAVNNFLLSSGFALKDAIGDFFKANVAALERNVDAFKKKLTEAEKEIKNESKAKAALDSLRNTLEQTAQSRYEYLLSIGVSEETEEIATLFEEASRGSKDLQGDAFNKAKAALARLAGVQVTAIGDEAFLRQLTNFENLVSSTEGKRQQRLQEVQEALETAAHERTDAQVALVSAYASLDAAEASYLDNVVNSKKDTGRALGVLEKLSAGRSAQLLKDVQKTSEDIYDHYRKIANVDVSNLDTDTNVDSFKAKIIQATKDGKTELLQSYLAEVEEAIKELSKGSATIGLFGIKREVDHEAIGVLQDAKETIKASFDTAIENKISNAGKSLEQYTEGVTAALQLVADSLPKEEVQAFKDSVGLSSKSLNEVAKTAATLPDKFRGIFTEASAGELSSKQLVAALGKNAKQVLLQNPPLQRLLKGIQDAEASQKKYSGLAKDSAVKLSKSRDKLEELDKDLVAILNEETVLKKTGNEGTKKFLQLKEQEAKIVEAIRAETVISESLQKDVNKHASQIVLLKKKTRDLAQREVDLAELEVKNFAVRKKIEDLLEKKQELLDKGNERIEDIDAIDKAVLKLKEEDLNQQLAINKASLKTVEAMDGLQEAIETSGKGFESLSDMDYEEFRDFWATGNGRKWLDTIADPKKRAEVAEAVEAYLENLDGLSDAAKKAKLSIQETHEGFEGRKISGSLASLDQAIKLLTEDFKRAKKNKDAGKARQISRRIAALQEDRVALEHDALVLADTYTSEVKKTIELKRKENAAAESGREKDIEKFRLAEELKTVDAQIKNVADENLGLQRGIYNLYALKTDIIEKQLRLEGLSGKELEKQLGILKRKNAAELQGLREEGQNSSGRRDRPSGGRDREDTRTPSRDTSRNDRLNNLSYDARQIDRRRRPSEEPVRRRPGQYNGPITKDRLDASAANPASRTPDYYYPGTSYNIGNKPFPKTSNIYEGKNEQGNPSFTQGPDRGSNFADGPSFGDNKPFIPTNILDRATKRFEERIEEMIELESSNPFLLSNTLSEESKKGIEKLFDSGIRDSEGAYQSLTEEAKDALGTMFQVTGREDMSGIVDGISKGTKEKIKEFFGVAPRDPQEIVNRLSDNSKQQIEKFFNVASDADQEPINALGAEAKQKLKEMMQAEPGDASAIVEGLSAGAREKIADFLHVEPSNLEESVDAISEGTRNKVLALIDQNPANIEEVVNKISTGTREQIANLMSVEPSNVGEAVDALSDGARGKIGELLDVAPQNIAAAVNTLSDEAKSKIQEMMSFSSPEEGAPVDKVVEETEAKVAALLGVSPEDTAGVVNSLQEDTKVALKAMLTAEPADVAGVVNGLTAATSEKIAEFFGVEPESLTAVVVAMQDNMKSSIEEFMNQPVEDPSKVVTVVQDETVKAVGKSFEDADYTEASLKLADQMGESVSGGVADMVEDAVETADGSDKIVESVSTSLGDAVSTSDVGAKVADAIASPVEDLVGQSDVAEQVSTTIVGKVTEVDVSKIPDEIRKKIVPVTNAVVAGGNNLANALNAAAKAIVAAAKSIRAAAASATVKKKDGGMVRGAGTGTSDSIPAMLSNGEYVVPAKAVKEVGIPFLDRVKNGQVQKKASGGIVTINPAKIVEEIAQFVSLSGFGRPPEHEIFREPPRPDKGEGDEETTSSRPLHPFMETSRPMPQALQDLLDATNDGKPPTEPISFYQDLLDAQEQVADNAKPPEQGTPEPYQPTVDGKPYEPSEFGQDIVLSGQQFAISLFESTEDKVANTVESVSDSLDDFTDEIDDTVDDIESVQVEIAGLGAPVAAAVQTELGKTEGLLDPVKAALDAIAIELLAKGNDAAFAVKAVADKLLLSDDIAVAIRQLAVDVSSASPELAQQLLKISDAVKSGVFSAEEAAQAAAMAIDAVAEGLIAGVLDGSAGLAEAFNEIALGLIADGDQVGLSLANIADNLEHSEGIGDALIDAANQVRAISPELADNLIFISQAFYSGALSAEEASAAAAEAISNGGSAMEEAANNAAEGLNGAVSQFPSQEEVARLKVSYAELTHYLAGLMSQYASVASRPSGVNSSTGGVSNNQFLNGLQTQIEGVQTQLQEAGAVLQTAGVTAGSEVHGNFVPGSGFQSTAIFRDLQRFSDGGLVDGPGTSKSDEIPAMLSDGEYVVPAADVQAVGVDVLQNLPRFFDNGVGNTALQAPQASAKDITNNTASKSEDRSSLRPVTINIDGKKLNTFAAPKEVASFNQALNIARLKGGKL